MTPEQLTADLKSRYVIADYRHGLAILGSSFPDALQDLIDALNAFEVRRTEVDSGGGNKSTISARLDDFFVKRDWLEMSVSLKSTLTLTTRRKKAKSLLLPDDTRVEIQELETKSHYMDSIKQGVALDVEWNNKDTFFARDLGNFRVLHDLHLISVGVLVTRGPSLQAQLVSFGPKYRLKYGATTTHWDALMRYVTAGTSGSCPLVLVGIEAGAFVDDRVSSRRNK